MTTQLFNTKETTPRLGQVQNWLNFSLRLAKVLGYNSSFVFKNFYFTLSFIHLNMIFGLPIQQFNEYRTYILFTELWVSGVQNLEQFELRRNKKKNYSCSSSGTFV